MKAPLLCLYWSGMVATALIAVLPTCAQTQHAINQTANKSEPIPVDQLGAVAGKQYQGDGLSVTATSDGARLRCVFQRMEGQVTREGLWLTSTAENSNGERFRVVAVVLGRKADDDPASPKNHVASASLPAGSGGIPAARWNCGQGCPPNPQPKMAALQDADSGALPRTGLVQVADNLARFIRPGLTEAYSVSMDGVRQDFIIEQRPDGEGQLRVDLEVTGAKVEPLVNGARLVLDGSGRKIAYNRLRVVDATGRELPARVEVASGILPAARISGADFTTTLFEDAAESAGLEAAALRQAETPAATRLAVVVDDAAATYPVRIDPTFSDEDWTSVGGVAGPDLGVRAVVVDEFGTLYIGGDFSIVGNVMANGIAKWNGNMWSPLGSGMNNQVLALVAVDTDLYAGGIFTMAGGTSANYIAKWNGNEWSALGSGMNHIVAALAASGTNLYAGGVFTMAGETAANFIAKWDGGAWSALGSGIGGAIPSVSALAVSGTDLYAGGRFTSAGETSATNIARWNGSLWSSLGSGVNSGVRALAVSDMDLYVGGWFTFAGEVSANYIAKWDGSAWSALGSGMNDAVFALTVSGTNLYAGGRFLMVGEIEAYHLAKWNGSTWSALGSGTDDDVLALAVSGTDLYAGGFFTAAGNKALSRLAKANIGGCGGSFDSPTYSPATGFQFTFSEATTGQIYRIQTSPVPTGGSWIDFTNFTYTGPLVITDASAVPMTNRYFRAVTP